VTGGREGEHSGGVSRPGFVPDVQADTDVGHHLHARWDQGVHAGQPYQVQQQQQQQQPQAWNRGAM
jgi:hypothetical protein